MRQKYSIGPVWFLMFACAFFTSCVTQGKKVQQEELSQYVEPRIGTAHCRWFHFTPGAMPFGMAKPALLRTGISGINPVGRRPVTIIGINRSRVSPACMSFRSVESY